VLKLSARYWTLKMTNNVFTVRNVFCPRKDYNSFLGGKLTMFKWFNYGKGNGVIFRIISNYFVIYEAYFVIYEAYFVVGEFY
jgi:hypothetical protein